VADAEEWTHVTHVTQWLKLWWSGAAERLDALLVMATILVLLGIGVLGWGYTVASALLQVLGGIVLGAGLSAMIGTLTGRQAVRQQSAKDANVVRKRELYGPLYDEVKAVHLAFAEAKEGKAPFPQWIDDGSAAQLPAIPIYPSLGSGLTLRCWPEIRRGYRYTDFSPSAQALFDAVQTLARTYNTEVEAARTTAIGILAAKADAAITTLRESERYQRRHEQQTQQTAQPVPVGHEPKTPDDWFGYIDYISMPASPSSPVTTPGRFLAQLWLVRWPDTQQSQVLGWLLARDPGKAADYVQSNYPAQGMMYPPPPLNWIQDIFYLAWPELQETVPFKEAGAALLKRVQEAESVLEGGLRTIQERYEGGKPLV
jgi:hypothetical protein